MSAVASTQPISPALLVGTPVQSFAPSELYRFTVDQYERMGETGILTDDDRVELIDGYLVIKMGKGPAHFWVVETVEGVLKALLEDDWSVRREGAVRMPPSNEPEPDVVVARGTRATYLERHPAATDIVLIVEVSDTTYHRDRGKKWAANARSGIPVYWIIHLPARRVEVYTDPTPEGYNSRHDYHAGETIPLVIDGHVIGQVAVDHILPPLPAVPAAEGNGT
jgi:Uma2 family endonuclease